MSDHPPSPRFAFGKNWLSFAEHLDEERVAAAVESLKQRFGITSMEGKRFLDIGSGSGLFSLAARRLGAEVHSFDFDPDAVACAEALRDKFAGHAHWRIERGSALDQNYLHSLGAFDFVYSWGVLHHTGAMWQALENATLPLAPGGKFCVALYNDQGFISRMWAGIKATYVHSPRFARWPLVVVIGAVLEGKAALGRVLRLQNPLPFGPWADRRRARGMSVWHDLVDWVGGYPFEVAKPQAVIDFYRQKGFRLLQMKTVGRGLGCNEFVFERS